MFRKGDIVTRFVPSQEGGMKKGTRAIVKRILNDREFTLEGHEGIYLQQSFTMDTPMSENRQVSDLEELEQALQVIDMWNRSRPTSQMISIEAYPAQDGGNLYSMHGYDTHHVSALMGHLMETATNEDKAAVLEKAAAALRYGA